MRGQSDENHEASGLKGSDENQVPHGTTPPRENQDKKTMPRAKPETEGRIPPHACLRVQMGKGGDPSTIFHGVIRSVRSKKDHRAIVCPGETWHGEKGTDDKSPPPGPRSPQHRRRGNHDTGLKGGDLGGRKSPKGDHPYHTKRREGPLLGRKRGKGTAYYGLLARNSAGTSTD